MVINVNNVIFSLLGFIILLLALLGLRLKRKQRHATALQTAKDIDQQESNDHILFGDSFNYAKQIQPDPTLAALGFTPDQSTMKVGPIASSIPLNPDAEKTNPPLEVSENTKPATARLIIINIFAKADQQFVGYDLLQALLSAGLRYGEMSIFHRYEKQSGAGKILFSLASATKPGIFDMNNMGAFACRGLTLFMQLDGPQHTMQAFDILLRTAYQLSEDLGGELKDAHRAPLDVEKIAQFREIVRAHECNFDAP